MNEFGLSASGEPLAHAPELAPEVPASLAAYRREYNVALSELHEAGIVLDAAEEEFARANGVPKRGLPTGVPTEEQLA